MADLARQKKLEPNSQKLDRRIEKQEAVLEKKT
jgi:hypothetical protein